MKAGPDDILRPPPERGGTGALAIAIFMHLLLVALMAVGVHWHSHAPEAVDAELWAPTAHFAAPPPPAAPLEPVRQPPPPPRPTVAPKPAAAAMQQDAAIALAKARHAAALAHQKELANQLALQQRLEKQRAEQRALARRQAEEQARQLANEKAREQARLEAENKLAARKADLARQRKEARQLARLQQQSRSDYMRNLMAQAGKGPADSAGTAAITSGPSGGYGARLATLIRQNVTYAQIDQIQGDPKVVITVSLDPNSGEVIGARIKRSSGVASWDQAALRAVQKVGRFPADHGRWYTPMDVEAGPRNHN